MGLEVFSEGRGWRELRGFCGKGCLKVRSGEGWGGYWDSLSVLGDRA